MSSSASSMVANGLCVVVLMTTSFANRGGRQPLLGEVDVPDVSGGQRAVGQLEQRVRARAGVEGLHHLLHVEALLLGPADLPPAAVAAAQELLPFVDGLRVREVRVVEDDGVKAAFDEELVEDDEVRARVRVLERVHVLEVLVQAADEPQRLVARAQVDVEVVEELLYARLRGGLGLALVL